VGIAARAAPAELAVAEIATHLPASVDDRHGWAADIASALGAIGQRTDLATVCSVVAVTQVASGFEADRRLDLQAPYDFAALLERQFGPLRAELLRGALRLPDPRSGESFFLRFQRARTEGDIDRAYRDLVLAWGARSPLLVGLADSAGRWLDGVGLADLDPVATLGPMQVSARWAARVMGTRVLDPDLRALVSSRRGGLLFGSARLLGWPNHYARRRFVFADYNAGPFSSRNAAFQSALADLTGIELPLDGDLLSYRPDGTPRSDSRTLAALRLFARGARIDPAGLRHDLALEKKLEFESTPTWRAVLAAWSEKAGHPAVEARIPQVRVPSKHMPLPSSVSGYVQRVLGVYRACLEGRVP